MAAPNEKPDDDLLDDREAPEAPEKPVKREPTVKVSEEDGTATVDLGDDEKPDTSRRARRGGRQADEVARLRQENEQSRAELARLRAETQAALQGVQQRFQQAGEDPFKRQMANIRAEQESIQLAMRSTQMTEAQLNEKRQRFYELDDQANDLREQRVIQRAQQVAQQAARSPEGAGEEAIIRSEFPDVISHPQALAWAVGAYNQLVAEGEPRTLATSRKAMQKAAENPRFGLRQMTAPAPTATQQQRYGAMPIQAGARNGGSDISLDKAQMKMALARWPQLAAQDEKLAYAEMAKLLRQTEREAAG